MAASIIKFMHIQEAVDLKAFSTMRLGGRAKWLAEAAHEDDLPKLLAWATEKNVPSIMIGEGSNIVWRDEGFPGLVIVNRLMGKNVISQDDESVTVNFKAGEDWDEMVEWTVDQGWSGLEFMSRIPGRVGAAPVQNIGAYGGELSRTLIEVVAYDTQAGGFVNLSNSDCEFAYRTSRFKTTDRGRFMITAISLKLKKQPPKPPFYESLQRYFAEHDIKEYTPSTIRQAVTAIRKIKLPDPKVVPNNGSFFTNPIIETEAYEKLKNKFPDIKGWPHEENLVKISAGWLVEKAGFKGIHDTQTGMGTWDHSALVLINEQAQKTADLLAFKQKIVDKVQEMFGITLEQEPQLLP